MTSLINDIFNNYYFHNIQSEIYFIVVLPLPVLLLQSFHSLVDLLLFYWTATIFLVSLIIIQQLMQSDCEDQNIQKFQSTNGSFRRTSGNSTQIHQQPFNLPPLFKMKSQESQPTMPELPINHSRALDFDDSTPPTPLELQFIEVQQRFKGIHNMLINHSEYQSDLHQRKRGYKILPIDHQSLSRDFTNKIEIMKQIVSLVQDANKPSKDSINQILETKFQQYYLQRHYGGMICQPINLSIQERLDSQQMRNIQLDASVQSNSQEIVSKLGEYVSLIHESHILENQHQESPNNDKPNDNRTMQIYLDVPKIIEVQIPIIIYKIKETVVRYQQSDLYEQLHPNQNIEDIINKYSKPYENIYTNQKQIMTHQNSPINTPIATTPHTPANSVIVASIMLNSNHNLLPKETEIELCYSEFPDQANGFNMPLDSYAQLGSLISNESRPDTQRSSVSERGAQFVGDIGETIVITEKAISRSILQKFEQNQKLLNQQNLQLKQSLITLQNQNQCLQKRNKTLQIQNNRLVDKLQQQIQQNEYLSSKLDQINAQILQQKVQCLTHLNDSKERKIINLSEQLKIKVQQIHHLTKSLEAIELTLHNNQEILAKKQDEIQLILQQLHQKQTQIYELNNCEKEVIQFASEAEISLKEQIQILQHQKSELKDNLKEYQRRFQAEGLSLQYEQAAEIQGIIQSQQHTHSLQLQEVNEKYEQIIQIYQKELNQLKEDMNKLANINLSKSQEIINKTRGQIIKQEKNKKYLEEFQKIVKEYDQQLEKKDQEIMVLKSGKNIQTQHGIETILEKSRQTIEILERQLMRQRQERMKITTKLLQIDQLVRIELQNQKLNKEVQNQAALIQQLSNELQNKLKQNGHLKLKVDQQATQIVNLLNNQNEQVMKELKIQSQKLRKVNGKLKRYTLSLQEEIKAVCGMDQCGSHKNWINQLIEERNYYLSLSTNQAMPGLSSRNSVLKC